MSFEKNRLLNLRALSEIIPANPVMYTSVEANNVFKALFRVFRALFRSPKDDSQVHKLHEYTIFILIVEH